MTQEVKRVHNYFLSALAVNPTEMIGLQVLFLQKEETSLL